MKLMNIVLSTTALCLISGGTHLYGVPSTEVELPTQYISVADYDGTANERIEAAMEAATKTVHKTVLFPNGEYRLRELISLNRGPRTELHLIGESREGVQLIPDIEYLEANYNGGDWQNGGARLAHMINLSGPSVFDYVDVSIQNMTVDMKSQRINNQPVTYNVIGHGIRVGTGWREGQFKVDHVTIKNIAGYGIGIQDRNGHPKNNMILTNLLIEGTASDGIDTKNTSGEGNRNLVIRDVTIKDVGYFDPVAPALDLRYRTFTIERVKLISEANKTLPTGKRNNSAGISIRPEGEVLEARISDVYAKGFSSAIFVHAGKGYKHQNIHISNFKIHDYKRTGIGFKGTGHSGHTISDGYVYSDRGRALVLPKKGVKVHNVTKGPWPTETSLFTVGAGPAKENPRAEGVSGRGQ